MMFLHLTVCLLIATEVALGLRFYSELNINSNTNCEEEECEGPYDETDAHYDYNQNTCTGPHNWHNLAECWETCDRSDNDLQSPINIDSSAATFNPFSNFQYQNSLNTRVNGVIENKGDAPHFDTDTTGPTAINIQNVPGRNPGDRYTFNEMHIHLGRDSNKGSEHSVDNKFYPMEAHMVFWNRDKYSNAKEAKMNKDGLLAIGVFITAGLPRHKNETVELEQKSGGAGSGDVDCVCNDTDVDCIKSGRCACETDDDCADGNICRSQNYCSKPRQCVVRYASQLTDLMEEYYPKIQNYPSPKIQITGGISPADALPYSWDFHTYEGSLTTPPCYETVRWIVMRCPIQVSLQAFSDLQSINDRQGNALNTYGVRRPIQRGLPGEAPVAVERNF